MGLGLGRGEPNKDGKKEKGQRVRENRIGRGNGIGKKYCRVLQKKGCVEEASHAHQSVPARHPWPWHRPRRIWLLPRRRTSLRSLQCRFSCSRTITFLSFFFFLGFPRILPIPIQFTNYPHTITVD